MTSSQWVNTQPDAGALHALLDRLAARVPPAGIDDLYMFPTRRIAIGESTVFVVAGFDPDDTDRRRVITARYAVTRDRKGVATVQEKLDEHGTAPGSAVARIIQGVLRRLGEEGEQPPREQAIEGDLDRWWALVEELGGRRPEPPPEPASDAPASENPDFAAADPPGDPADPPRDPAGAPRDTADPPRDPARVPRDTADPDASGAH